METRPYRGEIDYDRLAHYFRALSLPARIRLLHKLQLPRTSSEIELPPFRKDRGLSPERALSRQAVEGHLEKLVEVGLVRSRQAERSEQAAREYVINAARLFVFVDELRRIALLQPAPSVAEDITATSARTRAADAPAAAPRLPPGPALVLVSGPSEGRAFPLEGAGPWVVGRDHEVAVSVPHDPYVSARNSEIWREGGRFFLRDLPDSANGTMHDWRLLEKGEAAAVHGGDTIGVGRSLLVLRGLG